VQSASLGGTVLQDDTYTWAQDAAGNPYISAKSSVLNGGTPSQQTALTTQTLDQYGNVTQSAIYPYNNSSSALRTYNSTYTSAPGYTSPYNGSSPPYVQNYVLNRLASSSLTVIPGLKRPHFPR
jgi:hypothetical protein